MGRTWRTLCSNRDNGRGMAAKSAGTCGPLGGGSGVEVVVLRSTGRMCCQQALSDNCETDGINVVSQCQSTYRYTNVHTSQC